MTQHNISTPAKVQRCTRCGDPVITAIVGGLTTVTNTRPLTVDEEIAVLLTGGCTFDLFTTGHQMHLEWRDVTRMRAGRNYPVVSIHPCTGARLEPVPPIPAGEVPDDPPF